jgi:hypothetical protein
LQYLFVLVVSSSVIDEGSACGNILETAIGPRGNSLSHCSHKGNRRFWMMSWRGNIPQPDHQDAPILTKYGITSQLLGCLICPDLYISMAPPTASAKLTLSYPLYAADFDPQNNGFLLVGGGGGEGRSGVGNKIVSSPRQL